MSLFAEAVNTDENLVQYDSLYGEPAGSDRDSLLPKHMNFRIGTPESTSLESNCV